MADRRARVPVEELVDLDALRAARGGREPTPANLRAALPPGWALDDDLAHAHRDLRLLFRQGWLLALGMVLFGGAAVLFFLEVLPRGWSGFLRFAALVLVLALVGGVAGPIITRALGRRR
jgi:hypothetical protein